MEAVRGTAAVRNGRRCSNSPTLASVRSYAALLVRAHECEDTVPCCVVGWDGLWEEVEIGLPSFLYPSPPAVTGRGQETGSVCVSQGTCLCSFFLIANSFSVTSAASRAYTPQTSSLQFPSFFFHVQVSLDSPRQRLHCLAALFSPPHNQHMHPSGLNATVACVCVCVSTHAHACACVSASQLSLSEIAMLPSPTYSAFLLSVWRERKRGRD